MPHLPSCHCNNVSHISGHPLQESQAHGGAAVHAGSWAEQQLQRSLGSLRSKGEQGWQ